MVKLTVFFAVIAVSLILDKVDSKKNNNIQQFLQDLQQQLKQEQSLQRKEKKQFYYAKDEDENYYGSLKKGDVDRIISPSHAAKKRANSGKESQQNVKSNGQYYLLRRPNSEGVEVVPRDNIVSDEDLPSSYSNENFDDETRQNEYSKVYVVLNSEAIKRSRNKDKLNALLSNILTSLPGQNRDQQKQNQQRYRATHDRSQNRNQNKRQWYQDQNGYQDRDRYDDVWQPVKQDRFQNKRDRSDSDRYQDENVRYQDQKDRNRERRYKGFSLTSDWLRRKMPRGSGEMYGKEIERIEPRPKPMPMRLREMPREKPRRLRERGGGGGGAGGHTAIPYIRQHGDIYERED